MTMYQHLIKLVLPCSIIIFGKRQVVFSNQDANRTLGVKYGVKIEDMLRKLYIKENSGNIDEDQYMQSKQNTDMNLINNNQNSNLYDFLVDEKCSKRFVCGFESFWGVFHNVGNSIDKPDEEDRCFEIKICNLPWEGSQSALQR